MRLGDRIFAGCVSVVVALAIYWLVTLDGPRPFHERANAACVERGGVHNIADGRVICRDGVVVKPR